MRKLRYFLFLVIGILMTGCGSEPVADTAEMTVTYESAQLSEESTAGKESAASEESMTSETSMIEETPKQNETQYITIDLSNAKEMYATGKTTTALKLTIISEEYNDIDWANEWYENKNLSLPMIGDNWDHFYDENYEYQWVGEELYIYEKDTSDCLYVLNYPTDRWYTNGNNAYLQDGIFYGSSVVNGYAEPDTCFMFAYDLNKGELIWRSADQSYNTMNFVVIGDVIICGYGFTEEPDYLYQINKNTGEIIDALKLKKKPDLLVEQDDKLYVHTYSYNYVIKME